METGGYKYDTILSDNMKRVQQNIRSRKIKSKLKTSLCKFGINPIVCKEFLHYNCLTTSKSVGEI